MLVTLLLIQGWLEVAGGGPPVSPRDLVAAEGLMPDLIEPEGTHLDPKPRDLNATVLRSKLLPNLDTNYLSINKPRHQAQSNFPFRRNRKGRLVPVGTMPDHLAELETSWLRLTEGGQPLATRVSAKLRRKLVQVLWALTACPVAHRWKDLGPRFWPRYIREGYCTTGPRRSCSVPPGMKCRVAATQHKHVLRWYCPKGGNHCRWIKINYPIVTKCQCACHSHHS